MGAGDNLSDLPYVLLNEVPNEYRDRKLVFEPAKVLNIGGHECFVRFHRYERKGGNLMNTIYMVCPCCGRCARVLYWQYGAKCFKCVKVKSRKVGVLYKKIREARRRISGMSKMILQSSPVMKVQRNRLRYSIGREMAELVKYEEAMRGRIDEVDLKVAEKKKVGNSGGEKIGGVCV